MLAGKAATVDTDDPLSQRVVSTPSYGPTMLTPARPITFHVPLLAVWICHANR